MQDSQTSGHRIVPHLKRSVGDCRYGPCHVASAAQMSTFCLKLLAYSPADSAAELSLNETLVATCEMFLVPATILFAAVGVANTRFVKLLVCLLGVAVAALWIYRVWLWTGLSLVDRRTGLGIAGLFGICWVLTLLHQLKSMFTGYDR